ncbi:MAG: DnaJ domain-containing protein [Sphingomicrobium sp.]
MTQDHYAILGVTPTAEPTVIRAAYLALMREYHPDRNSSPAAIARAQAIIAAFKVLGDFDRRNQYDWDRRRARESAEAAPPARPKRKVGTGAIAAGAIALATIGAVAMLPDRPAEIAAIQPETAMAEIAPRPKAARVERRAASTPHSAPRPDLPAVAPISSQFEEADLEQSKNRVEELALRTSKTPPRVTEAKPAALKPIAPKPTQMAAAAKPPPQKVNAAASPAPKAPAVAKTTSIDLASLDQFVMSFYGQSWRFGDARKRAALEQSRSGFVAQRGACLADSCKRAAYLKLMAEVSAIVESK